MNKEFTSPLSPDQLDAVIEAASNLSYRHRLISGIVPYTGLTRSEFCHLRSEWVDAFPTWDDPDYLMIHVPEISKCVGTCRVKPSGRDVERQDDPCCRCRPDGLWTPLAGRGKSRERSIRVEAGTAIKKLLLRVRSQGSLPFTPSSNFYKWLDELAGTAGLSRRFGFKALRRTYGTILIRNGFDSDLVADLMGYSHKYKTRPLFEAIDESPDWDEGSNPPSISRRDLIIELQRLAENLDRRPYVRDIEKYSDYSFKPFWSEFGGLGEALMAAGFEPPEHQIRTEELLEELRRLYEKLGRAPTSKDMEDRGAYCRGTYHRRFESWDVAKKAAGLPSRRVEMLDDLRRLSEEFGQAPTQGIIRNHGQFGYGSYYREFGGLTAACEEAGLSLDRTSQS